MLYCFLMFQMSSVSCQLGMVVSNSTMPAANIVNPNPQPCINQRRYQRWMVSFLVIQRLACMFLSAIHRYQMQALSATMPATWDATMDVNSHARFNLSIAK